MILPQREHRRANEFIQGKDLMSTQRCLQGRHSSRLTDAQRAYDVDLCAGTAQGDYQSIIGLIRAYHLLAQLLPPGSCIANSSGTHAFAALGNLLWCAWKLPRAKYAHLDLAQVPPTRSAVLRIEVRARPQAAPKASSYRGFLKNRAIMGGERAPHAT